jgi:hypothetical protein
MTIYRCRCGQPLGGFLNETAASGLAFSADYVTRAVAAGFAHHLSLLEAKGGADLAEHRAEPVTWPVAS